MFLFETYKQIFQCPRMGIMSIIKVTAVQFKKHNVADTGQADLISYIQGQDLNWYLGVGFNSDIK